MMRIGASVASHVTKARAKAEDKRFGARAGRAMQPQIKMPEAKPEA
jgi:hypothetical protein